MLKNGSLLGAIGDAKPKLTTVTWEQGNCCHWDLTDKDKK